MIKLAKAFFIVAALGCATGCATKLGNTAKSAEAAPCESEPSSGKSSTPPSNKWICSHPSRGLRYNFDASAAPEMAEWMRKKLMPTVVEWYPNMVEMFSAEGCEVPKEINFKFFDADNVSTVAGSDGSSGVLFNRKWVQNSPGNLEAPINVIVWAIVTGKYPNGPEWIRVGIARYFSSYQYKRKLHGDIEEPDLTLDCATYTESSEYAASFLNFVEAQYPGTVRELNALCRQGKYDEATYWKNRTGKTVKELEKEWKELAAVVVSVRADDGAMVTMPTLQARFGEQDVKKYVTEYHYPTKYDVVVVETNGVYKAVVEPRDWTMREVGIICKGTPTFVDGKIDLDFDFELVDEPSWTNYGGTMTASDGTKSDLEMEQPTFPVKSVKRRLLLVPGEATKFEDSSLTFEIKARICSDK
jgi:hypothetical protein